MAPKSNAEDIVGKHFGIYKVLELLEVGTKFRQSKYLCECVKCGEQLELLRYSLIQNDKKDLSSCQKCTINSMIGKTYNGILVLDLATSVEDRDDIVGTRHRLSVKLYCKCHCGKFAFIRAHDLLKNKSKSCGCSKKYDDPEQAAINYVYTQYKISSEKRSTKRKFLLTKEEFQKLIKSNCYYCGSEPSRKVQNRYSTALVNGIDRLDNDKNYTQDNTVACCKTCNYAKHTMGEQEFYKWVDSVHNYSIVKHNRLEGQNES